MGKVPEQFKDHTFDKKPENINKTGENKGSQWSKTIIRKLFDQKLKGKNLQDVDEELTAGELVMIAAVKNALGGDTKSLKELIDRLEGTAVQTVNQIVSDKSKDVIEWVDTPQEKSDEAQ